MTIKAIYEDEVLKPETPLPLREHQAVEIEVRPIEQGPRDDDDPTGWKTARELIGFIKDGPAEPIGRDHDKYLYGAE